MKKLNKKEFYSVLYFLSGFGGFTDLSDSEYAKEFWDKYLDEKFADDFEIFFKEFDEFTE